MPTIPLMQLNPQNINILVKYGSYAQHSNGYNNYYDYLIGNKYNPMLNTHPSPYVTDKQSFNNDFRPGLEVTNNIPSLKIDQPYYRTLPNYLNQDIPGGYVNPKFAHEVKELTSKNICINCNRFNHHNKYPLQSAVHYQHEKLAMDELLGKNVYNSYLPPYLARNPNHDYSHQQYSDPIEEEKQRQLYNINYSSYYGRNNYRTMPSQNNSQSREPLLKSNPHYLKYKPYSSVDKYNEYRFTTDGLLEHRPKQLDYNPVKVKDYHNYNDKVEPVNFHYGHENYSPHNYTNSNIFSDVQKYLLYPSDIYNYDFNSTGSDYTYAKNNAERKVYYNPYFEYKESKNVSYTQSNDLVVQVLQKLLNSSNKYPNFYYSDDNYAPQRYRHLNDIDEYVKNNYNPYVKAHNSDVHLKNEYNGYAHDNNGPYKYFKEDVLEEIKLYPKNEFEPYTNIQDHIYTDPKIYGYAQNDDSPQNYRHFKDVVGEVTKLLHSKNKHNPYPYPHTTNFYQSRPDDRVYGKITYPTDGRSVGLLNPYKVKPSPYILPEYRRYSSPAFEGPQRHLKQNNYLTY